MNGAVTLKDAPEEQTQLNIQLIILIALPNQKIKIKKSKKRTCSQKHKLTSQRKANAS